MTRRSFRAARKTTEPFDIGSEAFYLQELTGEERNQFSDLRAGSLVRDDNGNIVSAAVAALPPFLLSRSLIRASSGEPAGEDFVNSLPQETQRDLYQWSFELSNLNTATASLGPGLQALIASLGIEWKAVRDAVSNGEWDGEEHKLLKDFILNIAAAEEDAKNS